MKGQYTTGEIAKMAGVTTRTIRFYKAEENFSFKVLRTILRRS